MASFIWTDLKQLVRDHVAATTLIVVAVLAALCIYGYSVVALVGRYDNLQRNICAAVAASTKGDPVQYRFWTASAVRAELRATTDRPALAVLDKDAAVQDRDMAKIFAPGAHPYQFPGC